MVLGEGRTEGSQTRLNNTNEVFLTHPSEAGHFIGLSVLTYLSIILLDWANLRSESKMALLLVETTIPIEGLIIGIGLALYFFFIDINFAIRKVK